jgi:hypothetical protein
MSTWVGMGPVIGPGSLDGFAIGVMMSGACFLAVTAPRRARRRQAVAAGTAGMLTAGPREWLSRRPRMPRISRAARVSEIPGAPGVSRIPEVSGARASGANVLEPGAFEAGAFGPGPFGAGPFAAGAERLARPDEPRTENDADCAPSVGDDASAAHGHRSRHRLNDSLPGSMSPGRIPRGGTSRDGGPRGGAAPGDAPRSSGGFPDSAFPESAFPESAFPDSGSPDTGFPDVPIPDEAPRDIGRLEPLPPYMAHPASVRQEPPPPDVAPRDGRRPGPRDGGRPGPRDGGRLEPPFPDWASRDGGPFPNKASRGRGRPDVELPDVEFPDVAFPDGTFGTSKRPESRPLPRHAAPTVGLGSKMSHWLTSLFARPEASGARG